MSQNGMIHPTHFLVPTVLSPSRTKTKGLNFFGSIKFGIKPKTSAFHAQSFAKEFASSQVRRCVADPIQRIYCEALPAI